MIDNFGKNIKFIILLLSIAALCTKNSQAKRMASQHETTNVTSAEVQEISTDTKEGKEPSEPMVVEMISDQISSEDVTSQSKPLKSKEREEVISSHKTNPSERSSSSATIPQGRLIVIPKS